VTAAEAIRWVKSRSCKRCVKSDNPEHDACATAKEVAELIRRLVENQK
jgi:hypothetical protein